MFVHAAFAEHRADTRRDAADVAQSDRRQALNIEERMEAVDAEEENKQKIIKVYKKQTEYLKKTHPVDLDDLNIFIKNSFGVVSQYFRKRLLTEDGDRFTAFSFYKGADAFRFRCVQVPKRSAVISRTAERSCIRFRNAPENLGEHGKLAEVGASLYMEEIKEKVEPPGEYDHLNFHLAHGLKSLVMWEIAQLIALAQPSSGAAERMFSRYRNLWSSALESALS